MRRSVVRKILGAISALTLAAVPVCASAHHSSALFAPSQSLTLRGVVDEFRWTNPHAFIELSVKDDDGQAQQWRIEMASPDQLARAGWRPGTLQAGDEVSLVIHPLRDHTRGGHYLSGTGPRGPLIDEPPPEPISALALSAPVANASCPRVEVTLVEPSASAETRPVKLGEHTVFVSRNAITTTDDISDIKIAGDDFDTSILIKYKPDAAARLLAATTDRDGLKLAFVVDDHVWLAFMWQGPYGIGPDGTQLSIRHGLARAQRLMESLRACTETRTR